MFIQRPIQLCSEFNRSEYSDGLIRIYPRGEFYVSRLILSTQSSYFRTQFATSMIGGLQRDDQGRTILSFRADQLLPIDQEETTTSLVGRLLAYLYGCRIDFSSEESPLLYQLADFFGVDSLKEDLLLTIRNVPGSDLGKIANIAWELQQEEVIKAIYTKLLRSPDSLLEFESPELMIILLRADELQINDLELINLLVEWRNRVGDEKVNRVLPYVRLASIMMLTPERVIGLRTPLEDLPAYQEIHNEALNWNQRWDTRLPKRRDTLRSFIVDGLIKTSPGQVFSVMSGGGCNQPTRVKVLRSNRVEDARIGQFICQEYPQGRLGPGSLISSSEYTDYQGIVLDEIRPLAAHVADYYWR